MSRSTPFIAASGMASSLSPIWIHSAETKQKRMNPQAVARRPMSKAIIEAAMTVPIEAIHSSGPFMRLLVP